ncbi:albusnodin family lasso peptide [Kitasatospora sp. NPDC096147]
MSDLTNTVTTGDEDDAALIEIGDLAALTEGQGQGSSEDKRRAYNS